MAAPSYLLTNYTGTADPATDVIGLIETQLTSAGWVLVETTTFTQSATSRKMRVWRNPSTLNASGADFYIGLVQNTATGGYVAVRAFEGWDTTNKLLLRPAMGGAQSLLQTWRSINYGNGQYLAGAGSGLTNSYATSPDGVTWTARRTTFTAGSVYGVPASYGNSTWVIAAVPSSSTYYSTDNALTWTIGSGSFGSAVTGLAFGAGLHVAVAGLTTAYSSPDGITWTGRAIPSATSIVRYGNRFMSINGVAAASTNCNYSTDGINWTAGGALPTSQFWWALAYGNSTWVAIGAGATASTATTAAAYSTTSGVSWSAATMPASAVWTGLTYVNSQFVATGAGGLVATSPDGANWSLSSTSLTSDVVALASNGSTGAAGVSNNTYPGAWVYSSASFQPAQLGFFSDSAIGTGTGGGYATSNAGAAPQVFADLTVSLSVTTNYDVAVLASKSYLMVGINANASATPVFFALVGLFNPAYADSQASYPPLVVTSGLSNVASTTQGVSRIMRVGIDAGTTGGFGVTMGPESIPLGSVSSSFGLVKDGPTQTVRGARAFLAAGETGQAGIAYRGGLRGWVYDAIVLNIGYNSGTAQVKVGDTVDLGGVTYTAFTQTAVYSAGVAGAGSYALFVNTAAGS